MINAPEDDAWRLAGNNPFNGLPENAFTKTSMHLTFTEYNRPLVQSDMLQDQDNQIFIQESVISVHNSGAWIGDVDVQACLDSALLARRNSMPCSGNHQQWETCLNRLQDIISIESWDDVVDPPHRDMVVRAHGSWIARLATALILIQSQKSAHSENHQNHLGGVCLFPKDSCWKCLCMSTFLGLHEHQRSYHPNSRTELLNVVIF